MGTRPFFKKKNTFFGQLQFADNQGVLAISAIKLFFKSEYEIGKRHCGLLYTV